MFRMDRNKPDKKEFVKILNPIFTWVVNCKNPLFEQVEFKVQNNLESGNIDFEVLFFFKGNNTFINIYQFYDTDKIVKIKSHIKDILKSKTKSDFDRIFNIIESI